MNTTPVKIPYTTISANALMFGHKWLLKKVPNLTEEQWMTMLFEQGYKFASNFSALFSPTMQKKIEDVLIKTEPEDGNPNNWFWMWWKLKWMQDDWQYITNKIYQQPISYEHYKSYMLNCEYLEQDLFNVLQSKQIFKL